VHGGIHAISAQQVHHFVMMQHANAQVFLFVDAVCEQLS